MTRKESEEICVAPRALEAVERARFTTRDVADSELDIVSGGWLPKFMEPPSNYDRALAKFRPK